MLERALQTMELRRASSSVQSRSGDSMTPRYLKLALVGRGAMRVCPQTDRRSATMVGSGTVRTPRAFHTAEQKYFVFLALILVACMPKNILVHSCICSAARALPANARRSSA